MINIKKPISGKLSVPLSTLHDCNIHQINTNSVTVISEKVARHSNIPKCMPWETIALLVSSLSGRGASESWTMR